MESSIFSERGKKEERREIVLIFLVLLFSIEPQIFTQFKLSVMIFSVGSVLVFSYFIVIFFKKELPLSTLFVLWVIYRIYLLVITIIFSGTSDLDKWGYLSLQVANIILLFDYVKGNEIKYVFKVGSLLLFSYLLTNAITLIVCKRGIISSNYYNVTDGDMYFLGIRTRFVDYMFAALSFSFGYYFIYKKKVFLILAFTLIIFTLLFSKLMTGIICLLIGILFFVVFTVFKNHFHFKYEFGLISSFLVTVFIVFFNGQNYLPSGFLNEFGKDLTLSNRVAIWESALKIIPSHLITGVGIFDNGNFAIMADGTRWQGHNQLIQNLYESGIIGTLFFYFIIFYCGRFSKKIENRYIIVLNSIVFALMIGCISEIYFYYVPSFVPLVILSNIKKVEFQNEK